MTKCFFVEGVSRRRLSLRRYSVREDHKCPKYGYHNGQVFLRDEDFTWRFEYDGYRLFPPVNGVGITDAMYPIKCDHCDYVFKYNDGKHVHQDRLYSRPDTGDIYPARELPVGALWYDDEDGYYHKKSYTGSDGRALMAMCPGQHEWCIDSRANNCTMPNDWTHRCWIRHGDPKTGNIHVDKNGNTCQAGAGSIMAGDYHGFLHNGQFTGC